MDLYLLKFPYRKILLPLAKKLYWLDPDVVSYAAVLVALATGWCFYKAADSRVLLLIAIVLTLLRMTLNTIDGVMAIQRGKHTLVGDVVNALPDRYSDIFVIGGIALSPLCRDWLGLAGVVTMLLVSYTGMLGKAVGVSWQHHGPLGKVERLIIIMGFALFQFFLLPQRQAITLVNVSVTPIEIAMGLFVVLGQYTVFRRVRGQLTEIHIKEGESHRQINKQKAIVIYDTMTGNTRRIAEEIARGIGCEAIHVNAIEDISAYSLVILGSPNIRKRPTPAIQKFQSSLSQSPPYLAVFTTFGLPLWGHFTAPMCLRFMTKQWNKKPLAQFACPGFHRKYKTYKGRPAKKDMDKAYIFGLKLAKKLEKQLVKELE